MSKDMVLAILYRFGYDLTVIETTEEKATETLMKEYNRAYRNINNEPPTKEEISNAKDDIEYNLFRIGDVVWR